MLKQKVGLKICLNGMKWASLILITILTLSGTALAAILYTLDPIPDFSLYTGDSTTVSFSITNNYYYTGVCAFRFNTPSWSKEFIVDTHGSITQSISVQAPAWGSGAGSVQHTVYTYCYNIGSSPDYTKVYKSTSFTLTYTENPRYIASQAINSAQSAINSAQSSINNAQNAINDAKNLGADVSLAENKLSNAQNFMQTAQSKQSAANSYYASSNYNPATNTANEAKSSADSAKTDADNAYSIAVQAKQIVQAKMNTPLPTPTPTPKASVSIDLHGEKTDVVLGEDILLKLSAVNYISMPKMHVQVIIIPPSGMSVTSSEFSMSGAGQFTSDYELDPGKGRDIEVRIKSNQVGDFNVKGKVVYYFGDEKEKYEEKPVNLPITVRKEPVDSAQNSIANPAQKSIPGFGAIIGISGLLFVIFFKKKEAKN